MTSEEAIAYLNSQQQTSDSQPEQSSPSEDTKPTEAGPGEAIKTPEPETAVDTGREPEDTKVPENKPEEVPPTKKKPSRQEQINHAFQRNKQKFKAELEAKDKRIAELEEKVKKYSVLEQGDFDPNDVKSYIDHLRQLDKEQAELDTLKAERTKMVNEDRMNEATERHARQVDSCFSSDEEKAHYWNLLRNGGDKFREFLNEYDDGTIDQFIGDSDIAPVLISTLMRNPEVLKSIVEKRNPMRKMIALQQLETRLNLARKVGAAKASQGAPETKPTAKLPITGSQVSNPGSSGESTARDWNRYLQEHPRGT
jgi:hypothetical protein